MALELNSTVFDKSICKYHDDEQNEYLYPTELHLIRSTGDIDDLIRRKIGMSVHQCCSEHGFVLSGIGSTRSRTQSNRALHKPLQIITRSAGEIPPEHLNGNFLYKVCYRVFACNPPIGAVLPVTVLDKNKLGIRCYYYPYKYDTDRNEVSNSDVIRAAANFVVIFLPKALHFNASSASPSSSSTGVDEAAEADANAESGEEIGESPIETLSPEQLYRREEARINRMQQQANPTHQAILHVKITQKRFYINDKQITAVGVLCADGYTGEAYTAAHPDVSDLQSTHTSATAPPDAQNNQQDE